MGIIGGIFHITNRPGERLYTLKLGSLEGVLASALAAVLFVSFVVAGTMWYGSAATPVELLLPDINGIQVILKLKLEEFKLR